MLHKVKTPKDTQRAHSVTLLAPRPKAFGGYKLDWSELADEIDANLEAFVQADKDYLWSMGTQGPSMLGTLRAIETEKMCPRLVIPFKGVADRWSPNPKDIFGRHAFQKMVGEVQKASYGQPQKALTYALNAGTGRAYHAAYAQLLKRSAYIWGIWPEEAGDWRTSPDICANYLRDAAQKHMALAITETKTRNDIVTVTNSYIY